MDPVGLNRMSNLTDVKEITDTSFKYKEIYWFNQPFGAKHPIAIDPPLQNDRMFAQQAAFTIHGTVPDPLEVHCANVIRKVILPRTALTGAAEFLTHANMNAYTIYPDIVNMARHIRRKVFHI